MSTAPAGYLPECQIRFGLLHENKLGTRGYIEPTLGVVALYTPRVIIDVDRAT